MWWMTGHFELAVWVGRRNENGELTAAELDSAATGVAAVV